MKYIMLNYIIKTNQNITNVTYNIIITIIIVLCILNTYFCVSRRNQ